MCYQSLMAMVYQNCRATHYIHAIQVLASSTQIQSNWLPPQLQDDPWSDIFSWQMSCSNFNWPLRTEVPPRPRACLWPVTLKTQARIHKSARAWIYFCFDFLLLLVKMKGFVHITAQIFDRSCVFMWECLWCMLLARAHFPKLRTWQTSCFTVSSMLAVGACGWQEV